MSMNWVSTFAPAGCVRFTGRLAYPLSAPQCCEITHTREPSSRQQEKGHSPQFHQLLRLPLILRSRIPPPLELGNAPQWRLLWPRDSACG